MISLFIAGAGSAIAQAVARRYVAQGASFFLVDLDAALLDTIASDLRTRGAARVETVACDLTDTKRHQQLLQQAADAFGTIDLFFVAYGTLPKQKHCEQSMEDADAALRINFTSPVLLLLQIAALLERQRSGTIAAISSVAGDRGRRSNYLYGAAKGGLALFLQGLRSRLLSSGVHVLTIKPGFVDTPMTQEFPKGMLWASPDRVARDIVRAIDRKQNSVYTPWFWRWIMRIIRFIPERFFKQMSL